MANKKISDLDSYIDPFVGTELFVIQKDDIPAYKVEYNVLAKSSSLFHTHSFSQIQNTPTTLIGYGITDAISQTRYETDSSSFSSSIENKQNILISGTNIKTINSVSVLGSGDIAITGSLTLPTSSVDNGIVVFDGTGGNMIKNSNATITSDGYICAVSGAIVPTIRNSIEGSSITIPNKSGSLQVKPQITSIPYSSSITLSFESDFKHTLTVTGNVFLSGSNYTVGSTVEILITSDIVDRTITVPPNWYYGGSTQLTTLSANKKYKFSSECWGSTDSDILYALVEFNT